MDSNTLISLLDFGRARLIGSLDAIEKSGQDVNKVLLWRPAPGRAHIAWQVLHCAATMHKFHDFYMHGKTPAFQQLVECYDGGTTPKDEGNPSLAEIRDILEKTYAPMRQYISSLTPVNMEKFIGPPDRRRKMSDAIVLLIWHEAHHQGQVHLTWNLYRQAHGLL